VGLQTSDDFRFVRLATEVPPSGRGRRWFPFAKGGAFSRFYADVYLVVDWEKDGRNVFGYSKAFVRNPDFFFRPGLTWPRRTTSGLSLRVMPAGCIFADKGPAAFVEGDDPDALLALLALMNSRAFGVLVQLQLGAADAAARSYEVGVIQQTPVPALAPADQAALAARARQSWALKHRLDTRTENSHAFTLPALLQVEGDSLATRAGAWAALTQAREAELIRLAAEIDTHAYRLYGLDAEAQERIERGFGADADEPQPAGDDEADETEETDAELDAAPMVASLMSWALGVAFGRFDVRLATGERDAPPEPEPFDPLPVCSPGMLTGDDALPVPAPPAGYPLTFPTDGVLVDDAGHPSDLVRAVRAVFDVVFEDSNVRWHEAAELLSAPDLRTFFARDFFEPHIKRYSKSRRKAPIYWQLATPSAGYSVWLYIHAFTNDTLFRVQNDYVAPKLAHEERRLESLTNELRDGATARQRKELAAQEAFVEELRAFLDEVKRVAPLWNPNLDDGVIINFAPLWRLVPQHKAWQRELKATWDALCAGKYDWAHLAMHLWPERVVPKCARDRSLAIAHGLEEVFWVEGEAGKWTARKAPTRPVAELVEERTSPAVKEALASLLAAPPPAGAARARGRRRTK